jgi:hypothetical protein
LSFTFLTILIKTPIFFTLTRSECKLFFICKGWLLWKIFSSTDNLIFYSDSC